MSSSIAPATNRRKRIVALWLGESDKPAGDFDAEHRRQDKFRKGLARWTRPPRARAARRWRGRPDVAELVRLAVTVAPAAPAPERPPRTPASTSRRSARELTRAARAKAKPKAATKDAAPSKESAKRASCDGRSRRPQRSASQGGQRMSTALYIFGGTFVTVFALGLQSLNVNGGHYWAAALTSFAIAGGNLVILKFVPQGELAQVLAYLAAGPLAIVASMLVHQRTIGRRRSSHAQERFADARATRELQREATDDGERFICCGGRFAHADYCSRTFREWP
jgi:hypothetical protein